VLGVGFPIIINDQPSKDHEENDGSCFNLLPSIKLDKLSFRSIRTTWGLGKLKIKRFLLLLLAVLIMYGPALAQGGELPAPDPVVLTDEQGQYRLGLHLEILEDPNGELTIDQVASPKFDDQFTPSQVEVPNYGYTNSAYWVRLYISNQTRHTDRWLLEQGFANTHYVDLYTPLPNGEGYSVKQTGVLRPTATRDIPYPRIIFALDIPPGSEQTYYLRFQNGASMTLPLTLWSQATFINDALVELLWMGIFYGVLAGLLLYYLFLLFSLREASYLYFVAFLASLLIQELSYDGYLATYVIPNWNLLKANVNAWSFSLMMATLVLFSDSFLEIKTRLPKLHWINLTILIVWAILILIVPFTSYYSIARVGAPLGLVSLLLVLIEGIVSSLRGFRPARFFLIAWVGLLVSIFWVLLIRLGITSSSLLSENLYRPGVLWMAVCWAIALADRINLLKAQTEVANLNLRDSEHRLSEILEGLPIGVILYGKDHKPIYANRRLVEILSNPARGIRPDPSVGRTLAQAIQYFSLRVSGTQQEYPLEDFPIYSALQGKPAVAEDIEADLGDRLVPLEIRSSPIKDQAGNVESAVVAIQDITQRRQVEMALRASETRLRVVVDNNLDGIIFMSRDRKLLYVSPSYARLVGMTTQELIGKSGFDFIHPDDQARIAEKFQEVLQQPGGVVNDEYRIRHQDGVWIWIETNAVNLLDEPNVQAVVLNSRNITERKQADAELDENRKSLESLVEKRTSEISAINTWLSTLNKVHQTLNSMADLPQAYEKLSAVILQLFTARAVFTLRWDGRYKKCEVLCCSGQDGLAADGIQRLRASFEADTPLRQEVGLGKVLRLTADRDARLSAALGDCFSEQGYQSLVLAPMITHQAVVGVLGVALPGPPEDFSPQQISLIEKMGLDLADLAEDALLHDQALVLAKAEERNRLARDLHDSVTQVLFSASLIAEILPQVWRRNPERGLQSLEKLRLLSRGALAEMRAMLIELRPSAMIHTPLSDLLAQMTEAVTSRSGLPYQLSLEPIPPLPEEVQTVFYRIAQEALNNVVKHAQASQVMVRLNATPPVPDPVEKARQNVELVIQDNGVGFAFTDERSGHLGLGIMHERAAAIRATLSVESKPGYGTRVALIWYDSAGSPT
jgi:PAS domain S-box-containing protein